MIRSPLPVALSAALALAACSSEPDPREHGVAQFELAEESAAAAVAAAMPGKIDPPDATWQATERGARYGEPGKPALLVLACKDGLVSVTRNAPSDKGAKALLAFVGYRGILRLKVENDGKAWHGALRSDDPHWIAVTGGPFYATVAGGGKVISPASSIAADVVRTCEPKADAAIKGIDESGGDENSEAAP